MAARQQIGRMEGSCRPTGRLCLERPRTICFKVPSGLTLGLGPGCPRPGPLSPGRDPWPTRVPVWASESGWARRAAACQC